MVNSFTVPAIALPACWLKMHAEKTRVLWLDRNVRVVQRQAEDVSLLGECLCRRGRDATLRGCC